MPLTPGGMFERYEIETLIGRGGMGEVYRAVDTRLHRPVALKVLRADKESSTDAAGGVARLLREARAAAAFNHAHSVAIYELGEAEGIPYIAMEYVNGTSLRTAVGDAAIALDTKTGWLVDAARALHAAHKAGLVHRDVKPGNIMISDDGVVKVLDFGLAKAVHRADPSGFQTQMGQVLGTPKYMAPEQLEGEPANAKADQFAFGLVAYELVTGRYAGGPLAMMPKRVDAVTPGASRELGAIIERMLARRPAERFASMEEVANALKAVIPTLGRQAGPSTETPRARNTPSDAPTREVRASSGAIDASVSQARQVMSKTVPMGVPLGLAVGAPPQHRGTVPMPVTPPGSFSVPPAASSSSRMLHARPSMAHPQTPHTASLPAGPMSGVHPARDPSLLPQQAPISTPRRASGPPWALVVAVFAIVAILGGAVAAYVLR